MSKHKTEIAVMVLWNSNAAQFSHVLVFQFMYKECLQWLTAASCFLIRKDRILVIWLLEETECRSPAEHCRTCRCWLSLPCDACEVTV